MVYLLSALNAGLFKRNAKYSCRFQRVAKCCIAPGRIIAVFVRPKDVFWRLRVIQDNDNIKRNTWYVRRDKSVEGPFTSGLIQQYVLLERIDEDTELSHDLEHWRPLCELPDLVPEVMKADLNDPQARERLMAARRWADERSRAAFAQRASGWEGEERRHHASWPVPEHAHEIPGVEDDFARGPLWGTLLAVGILISIMALIFFNTPPSLDEEDPCSQPPQPGVNWSSCHMEGADFRGLDLAGADMRNMNLIGANLSNTLLSGANLSYARLSMADLSDARLESAMMIGAGLRGANLRGADLSGADLSYVELTGAHIEGANLAGAVLDNAIWIDGQYCGPGSVGRCLMIPRPSRDRL